MNPFRRQTVYLRHPNGGVENIDQAYQAGMRTFLLTMHDPIKLSDGTVFPRYSYEPWRTVIERISKYPDAVYLPWGYIWKKADLPLLRDAANIAYADQTRKLARPAGCWNTEAQLRDGAFTLDDVIASADGCDVLISSEGWPYDNIPWSKLPEKWTVDAQLFPAENWVSTKPRDCRARWFAKGVKAKVHFQHGIHDVGPEALPHPMPGRYSIYAMDDVKDNWGPWSPKPLEPLSTAAFSYAGPFYGPSSGKAVSKHPQIVKIKRALHRAGYGTFTNPDEYWNRSAENALKNLQRDLDINPTGQYGLMSWQAMRTLASANPGETYAYK